MYSLSNRSPNGSISTEHLLAALDYLVERSHLGFVSIEVACLIDERLPPYGVIKTSDVVGHAADIGLLSRVAQDGEKKLFIHVAALDLLGLDASELSGDYGVELTVVAALMQRYSTGNHPAIGRLFRAAAAIMTLVEAEVNESQVARLAECAVANQHNSSTAMFFWLEEADLGLEVAKAEGFVEPPADGSTRAPDHSLTDRGRAWLSGNGSAFAENVKAIELKGVL